jgi:hypothetical protein
MAIGDVVDRVKDGAEQGLLLNPITAPVTVAYNAAGEIGQRTDLPNYGGDVSDDTERNVGAIGDQVGDSARETAQNASDALTDIDVPWEVKGLGGLVALALLAVAFGQLFNINVGGGQ